MTLSRISSGVSPSVCPSSARDEFQTARVVVEQEGCRPDGRICEASQRLRSRRHPQGVIHVFVDENEVLVGACLLGGQTGRSWCADGSCLVDFCRDRAWHVGMDAEQLRWRLRTQGVGDDGTPITARRDEVLVAEALHQCCPGLRDPYRPPAGRGRLAGEAETRNRRDDHMEGVRCAPAVGGRIGERSDDLQLFDHRTRPAMGHDDRQRIFVL